MSGRPAIENMGVDGAEVGRAAAVGNGESNWSGGTYSGESN